MCKSFSYWGDTPLVNRYVFSIRFSYNKLYVVATQTYLFLGLMMCDPISIIDKKNIEK